MSYEFLRVAKKKICVPGIEALLALSLALVTLSQTAGADTDEEVPLENGSLVITHASRHYHTDPDTISSTNRIVEEAVRRHEKVYALAQEDIRVDPDWYTLRDSNISAAFASHHGESPLFPEMVSEPFEIRAVGGYMSACLGWTLSELASRFLERNPEGDLTFVLPMAAIYTGYRFDSEGERMPATPYDEANADTSEDGLDLLALTRRMNDESWRTFMKETLRIGVFEKAPLWFSFHGPLEVRLERSGRLLDSWHVPSSDSAPARRLGQSRLTFSFQ